MPVEMNGERYYTIAEAIKYLGISRDTFYRSVKDNLKVYHYGALKRAYFREADLNEYKTFRPAENGDSEGPA